MPKYEMILILDFGGHDTQSIARKIRKLGSIPKLFLIISLWKNNYKNRKGLF